MRLLTFILLMACYTVSAQLPFTEQQFMARIKPGNTLPEKLLSTRTAVFFPYFFKSSELEKIQQSFQKTGIDAVMYLDGDFIYSGRDPLVALAELLNKREITNLIIFQKDDRGYRIYITEFNKKANLVEQDQQAWTNENVRLDQLLSNTSRVIVGSLKNENFLINDLPETGFNVNAIDGERNEFFAADLKVDPLAVPKFGNEAMDKELEEIMKSYPYKYTLTEAGMSESELRKAGYLYVLRFVHARNKLVRAVLGYETGKAESAIVSMTFADPQSSQLKNIPANQEVFKFYFKHIENKNVFLGRKWDADPSWQQALWNQLYGYKSEFKMN